MPHVPWPAGHLFPYVAELRARDQEAPLEPFLEIDLDLLTGHRLRAMWKVEKLRWTGN